jgi:transposase InsO family protein
MYCITGLPEVDRCNALWVIVDRLTKMAHFVACKETMGPKDLVDEFLLHMVWAYGLPNNIISDRGSLFTSLFWKQIMAALGTSRNLSTTFHPETDGQTERTNATLEQYLCAYGNYQQDNWKHLLPVAEFCYNNTKSETTGATPFFANFGYHPPFQPDLAETNKTTPDVSSYVSALTNLHEELRSEIKYAQMGHAEQANKGRQPDPILKPGDKVWL